MDGESNNYIRYKLLLENASDLIIVIQDNKIEFVNQKPLADLGYSIDDVSDKNIFDFIHVDDREKVNEFQIKKAKNEGLPDDLIFRILSKKGRLLFVKITSISTAWEGKPARLVCVKNITDKRLNELTVKNSEHLLSTIINNLPDPTFVIDINGKVYLWNKALEKISGVKSQDIIGKREYENTVPFHGYKGPLLIDLMLKSDAEIEKEYDFFERTEDLFVAGRFLKSDEKNIHVWATSSILCDIQGNIIGAVESFRDMTEIKNAEEKIKASIKEKEILLKEIHHRIRNNMRLINNMFNIQLQFIRDPEAVDLFMDSISRINAMALIHNDLYSYTADEEINFGEFIPKLIDNLSTMYKRKDIRIKIEAENIHLGIDDAVPPCSLILNELVSNSIKHAFPEGEKGTILIKLFLDKNSRLCYLVVHDNGKGLPPGFDFNKNTTSFGLLMVNLLSSQLQGTVRLNSVDGTEFKIAFPVKIHKE